MGFAKYGEMTMDMYRCVKCSRMVVLFTVVVLTSLLHGAVSVKIIDLDVPPVVKNGSKASVVLDCIYSFEDNEKLSLVIKWYFGDDPSPVYQWIPQNAKPQVLGKLKGKVNLNHEASADLYEKYRALEILHPTTELSGEYECKVSSLFSEDVMRKKMIVYSPVEGMSINVTNPDSETVNVTCLAEGVYPEPQLTLYKGVTERDRTDVKGSSKSTKWHDGVYDVMLHKIIHNRDLQSETMFQCSLTIPGTAYKVNREIVYYSGPTPAPEPSAETTKQSFAGYSSIGNSGPSSRTSQSVSVFIVTLLLLHFL